GDTQVIRQQNLATNSFSPTTPLTAGDYVAWVEAFDNTNQARGWSPAYNFTLTLPAITVSAGPDLTGDAGTVFSFNGSAGGGTGALSYSWDFGDGAVAAGGVVANSGTLTPSHIYLSAGDYLAKLTVRDSTGMSATSTAKVKVRNVAPKVSVGGPY